MDVAEIVVVVGAGLLIAFILWFFFGPGAAGRSNGAASTPSATKDSRSI